MEQEARTAAVQILLAFGGCGFLLAAAIVAGFEHRLPDALDVAAPWLVATGFAWGVAAWIGLPGRSARRGSQSHVLLLAAVWLAAAMLGVGVAGLVGHDGAGLAAGGLATAGVAGWPTRILLD